MSDLRVFLYQLVCLSCALKRPKTLPGENAVFNGRFVLKHFVSLSEHLKTEAFESEHEKFVT